MTHRSTKTIRTDRQWVKITRDSNARQFTFYRGDKGVLKAKEVQSFSFTFIQTWADAKEHALLRMASYP